MYSPASASFIFVLALLAFSPAMGQVDQNDMAEDLDEALSFTKYPTYELYEEMMQGFAASFPEICHLDTFGTSVQGRLLLAIKISGNVKEAETEADVFLTSTMHGDELLGYPLLLRLADSLLNGYGNSQEITSLVDSLAIWINPLANPDGTYSGGNHTVAHSVRETAGGYDLNRFFPDISKNEADDESERPLENMHMMRFLRSHTFTLSANIHSGYEVVNYPWDWTFARHPDDAWYQLISREYVDEAHEVDPSYMLMENDGITNGADWYVVQGSRQDYVNYFLGGREVTLELSHDYRLDANSLDSYWEKNRRSLLYYITQATYGIRGRVRSKADSSPVKAMISIPGHDNEVSRVFSDSLHGCFYRLIKGGTYDLLFSADGYKDLTIKDVMVEDFNATWLDIQLEPLSKGSEDIEASEHIMLYPNPAGDFARLQTKLQPGTTYHMQIFAADGRKVMDEKGISYETEIYIRTVRLERGLYLLKLSSASGRSAVSFLKN